MKCPTLNVQHRMRPEISCLIAPLIYPDLKNHESVLQFDPIKGVSKNIYFVEHKVPEFEVSNNLEVASMSHFVKFFSAVPVRISLETGMKY